MENKYRLHHTLKPCYMKLITAAFITLLGITVLLIVSFKHISAETSVKPAAHYAFNKAIPATKIGDISLPDSFARITAPQGSFAEWLRNITLRKNNIVYMYNGRPVEQQGLHYAVLDISTGDKDLQQCADAVMRLRAEYFFSRKEYSKIAFGEGRNMYRFNAAVTNMDISENSLHAMLLKYLESVFINCGTYTVDAMTKPVAINDIQPGDVFIKAGSPGHTMIVADVAQNMQGEKIYLLAQSYMPAQDMHIVINPVNRTLSPWYAANEMKNIVTPGWVFTSNQLKRWK